MLEIFCHWLNGISINKDFLYNPNNVAKILSVSLYPYTYNIYFLFASNFAIGCKEGVYFIGNIKEEREIIDFFKLNCAFAHYLIIKRNALTGL